MTPRVLTVATVLSVAALVSADAQSVPEPRVQETTPRGRVSKDPAINPSSGTRPTPIPIRALVDDAQGEEEKRTEGWAVAKWTAYTLRPAADARQTISVPGPSVLLLRASWPGRDDVAITVTNGRTTLASLTDASASAGGRLVTARVNVPSAGEVVIAVRGARTAKVTLHVGVLATP